MKDFILLQRLRMREYFNSLNKKKVLSNTASVLLSIVVYAIFIIISIFVNFTIYQQFKLTGDTTLYVPTVTAFAFMLVTFTSLMKVKGALYDSKDYIMLKTMPIKKSSIIASKIFNLYLSEIKFSLISLLVSAGFLIYYNASIIAITTTVIAAFLLPIIPILVFGIISVIFGLFFEGGRYGSIISTLLYIVFLIGIYVFMYVPKEDQYSGLYTGLYNGLKYVYPLLYFIRRGIEGSGSMMALFVGINVVVFIFSLVLISLTYDKINMSSEAKKYKTNEKIGYKINTNVSSVLRKKDIKRVLTSTPALMNVIIGPIMAVFIGVLMYFSSTRAGGFESPEDLKEFLQTMGPMSIAFTLYMFGICPFTAFCISIENKNLWIIKTAPIDHKDYYKAKIETSLIFTLPFVIISGVVQAFMFKLPIYTYILAPLLIFAANMTSIYMGLIFNLKKPHLDYNDENEMIKKGSSVGKCLAFSFIGVVVSMVVLVATSILNILYVGFIALTIVYFIIVYLLVRYLDKNGERLFDNIS